MMDKIRTFLIHAMGGLTKQEVEKSNEALWREINRCKARYNELVSEYGRIETISARRKIDPFALHEYEPKILADMMKELCDKIREAAGRLVERQHCDDYERNLRTVAMSIRMIRNEHF